MIGGGAGEAIMDGDLLGLSIVGTSMKIHKQDDHQIIN
jgi:hypothetical protein